MEESKLKSQKLNQLSKPLVTLMAKRDSTDTNISTNSDDNLVARNFKNGLRSSNRNQYAPKIYTNNISGISNIPRYTGLDKRPSPQINKINSQKTCDEMPNLESDESIQFRNFLNKRISNTSLTRHTSLLDKTKSYGQFKSTIISVPPPPTSTEPFDFFREETHLTGGFKIYSNSQNNLKLNDSNDSSLVELIDDSNDVRQISSPISRKLSQKSNLSSSSSTSSNEISSSKRESIDLNSSPTLKEPNSALSQAHKSKSSFSSLSSKKYTSPTSSFSSSNVDTKSNKQGIAYINIDSFSCITNTSHSTCENEKPTADEDLDVIELKKSSQDSKLNCVNNINTKIANLINFVGSDDVRQKCYEDHDKNEAYDDITKSSISESLSFLKYGEKNDSSEYSITKVSDFYNSGDAMSSLDSSCKHTEKPNNIEDLKNENFSFSKKNSATFLGERKASNEKINRKNSSLVKKLIIENFPDTLSAQVTTVHTSSLTSNLRRNSSMPSKSVAPKLSFNNMLVEKSQVNQLQENFDVKNKIKQFEKIKADSLHNFNNSSCAVNCPSYSKLANDSYFRNSSSYIDERSTTSRVNSKAPNDFPSIKFKELKSIFESCNKNSNMN